MGFSTKQLMLAVASLGSMALDGLGHGDSLGGLAIQPAPHPTPRMKSRGQGQKPNRSRKHRKRSRAARN